MVDFVRYRGRQALFAKTLNRLVLAVGLVVAVVMQAPAEVAPPGQFIERPSHPFMPSPYGKYRTRLGWLIASMIRYENLYFWEKNPLTGASPGLYRSALQAEASHYRGLNGLAQYRYSEALVRDLGRIKIVALDRNRLSLALSTVPAALFADVSAMALTAGIKHVLPARKRDFLALDSRYLQPGTEQNLTARYAFIDLELRYRDLMDRSYLEMVKRQIGAGATAAELGNLMSESVISASIGKAIDSYRQSPDRLIDVVRRQKTKDVAAFGCACVLDAKTHRPPNAWLAVLGPTDDYLTRLGYLLSLKITPPTTTVLNALSGGKVDDLLGRELAELRKMRAGQPDRYSTYLRSFLVDTDTLEFAMLKALESGIVASVIESTAINALFGAFAIGGGGTAQVLAILANAGYGALDAYADMTDELRIRIQMATFRERLLDTLLPLAGRCGCGVGLAVAPIRTIKGSPPANN